MKAQKVSSFSFYSDKWEKKKRLSTSVWLSRVREVSRLLTRKKRAKESNEAETNLQRLLRQVPQQGYVSISSETQKTKPLTIPKNGHTGTEKKAKHVQG